MGIVIVHNTQSSIDKWFKKFDLNKDGKIPYDEFKNIMETLFSKIFLMNKKKYKRSKLF